MLDKFKSVQNQTRHQVMTIRQTFNDKSDVAHLFLVKLAQKWQFQVDNFLRNVGNQLLVKISVPILQIDNSQSLSLKHVHLIVVKQVLQHLLAILIHEKRTYLKHKFHQCLG